MAGINNNLYPPIFKNSYMPAFVKEEGCRIYFSISQYNSLIQMYHGNSSNVQAVQVVIKSQKTNKSVLNSESFPNEIMLTTLQIDENRKGEDKYYIEILNEDIEDGFTLNEYYKVQIRFTSKDSPDPPENSVSDLNKWLNENLYYFSEWSTVVLIRPISKPSLYINNLGVIENSRKIYNIQQISFYGRIIFDTEDNQKIKKYQITFYDSENNIIESSGDLQSVNNSIEYIPKYNFQENKKYKMSIQIQTYNLYSWDKEKIVFFRLTPYYYRNFQATIETYVDDKGGRIGLLIKQDDLLTTIENNIVIRRSSSKDNFNYWIPIYTFSVPIEQKINQTWYDYTVESGVWYKYKIGYVNRYGYQSTYKITEPVMITLEDIFLTTKDYQLKIRFDPNISNFSHKVSETLTETLGSKYPFIYRNANLNYRTFTLSGLITHFMDIRENLMKSSQQDLYGDALTLYDAYNNSHNINFFNDSTYEKDFRKRVLQFLYNNDIKLFRSRSEGNMLVKLMNITLNPKLQGHIYTFNCTVQQIDEDSYDNYIKYNIQDLGQYTIENSYNITTLGQLIRPAINSYFQSNQQYHYEPFDDNDENNLQAYTRDYYIDRKNSVDVYFGNNELIDSSILKEVLDHGLTEGTEVSIDYLYNLKIQLSTQPYLIGVQDQTNELVKLPDDADPAEVFATGHLVYINDQIIIIDQNGYYETTDPDLKITSIIFPQAQEQGVLNYNIVLKETQKNSIIRTYNKRDIVGQIWKKIFLGKSIYQEIKQKYNHTYLIEDNKYIFSIENLKNIEIYAPEGLFLSYRKKGEENPFKIKIDESNFVTINNDNNDLLDFSIEPPVLNPSVNDNPNEFEYYIVEDIKYDNLQDINNPIDNCVYIIRDFETINVYQEELKYIQSKEKNDEYILYTLWEPKDQDVSVIDEETLKVEREESQKYFIYYKNNWYPFKNGEFLSSNINIIVNYFGSLIEKGY